jgi:hypothetical protein
MGIDQVYREPRGPRDGPPKPVQTDYWKTHLLKRLPTPKWETRNSTLPLLAQPVLVGTRLLLDFGGTASREMDTFAFEVRPGSPTRFIGVAVPKGVRPSAYLLYFRHTARENHYPGGARLLSLGIGDYFEGRLQVCRQVSASGKNVAVILPIAIGSSHGFEKDEKFVSQCLKEIQASLFGGADGPLLLASNSSGISNMDAFIKNCPGLMKNVRAIYDLDGSRVVAARSVTLAGLKPRVIRYEGGLQLNTLPGENGSMFLARMMAGNPARVPLPHQRWISYPLYPPKPPDGEWLHYFIPTCMLHHGLAVTPDI